jgi:transcriptional regulator with XRE-family HTH domain
MEKTRESGKNQERFIDMPGINRFSERLGIAMAGISNVSLASACGISESAVRSYLKGRSFPAIDKIEAIAIACDAPMEWLITGRVNKKYDNRFAPLCESKILNLIELMAEEQQQKLVSAVVEYGISGIIAAVNGMTAIDEFMLIPEGDRERVLRLYKQIKEGDSQSDQELAQGNPKKEQRAG